MILTKREQKVLALACDGKTVKEIATTVGRSRKTVDKQLTMIYRKTGVHNRVQLLKWAFKNQFVDI